MVKKCYLLTHSTALIRVIADLSIAFPCRINTNPLGSKVFELYIDCRPQDVSKIEGMLARFV